MQNLTIEKKVDVDIEAGWKGVLSDEFAKSYFIELISRVKEAYRETKVFPPAKKIFEAFNKCPFDRVKVVILGQDPYHGYGQANGLCFSVNETVKAPPSLKNIFREIADDLNKEIPSSPCLLRWADQGVLLLNSVLTVEESKAGSHSSFGWEQFTDVVIEKVSSLKQNIVFLLWGAYAQKKGIRIDRNNHLVLESSHPSPFSVDRGFFGSGHFSKANVYLNTNGIPEIDW